MYPQDRTINQNFPWLLHSVGKCDKCNMVNCFKAEFLSDFEAVLELRGSLTSGNWPYLCWRPESFSLQLVSVECLGQQTSVYNYAFLLENVLEDDIPESVTHKIIK